MIRFVCVIVVVVTFHASSITALRYFQLGLISSVEKRKENFVFLGLAGELATILEFHDQSWRFTCAFVHFGNIQVHLFSKTLEWQWQWVCMCTHHSFIFGKWNSRKHSFAHLHNIIVVLRWRFAGVAAFLAVFVSVLFYYTLHSFSFMPKSQDAEEKDSPFLWATKVDTRNIEIWTASLVCWFCCFLCIALYSFLLLLKGLRLWLPWSPFPSFSFCFVSAVINDIGGVSVGGRL